MKNIGITIFVSLATSIAFNLYFYNANPVNPPQVQAPVALTHTATEAGLDKNISASEIQIKEAPVKVLPKTSVGMFYCSLAPNRYIAKFYKGQLSFWDLTTGSFEEGIKRTPDDTGTYELFQTYIKMTHDKGGEVGIFKIHEVEPSGKIISFKELDIVLSIMNCDF